MTTHFDIRQSISHDTLDQLVTTTGKEVDDILRSVNSELTPLLRMVPANPGASLILNIGAISAANPETSRNRVIPPINNLLPTFASGTIMLSGTGAAGTATPSVGAVLNFVMAASQYLKIGVHLDATGNLLLTSGTPAGTLAGASAAPVASGTYAIGYLVVRTDGSNAIQNIASSDVYQYVGGGTGSGAGGASLLDPNFDETFVYYTRSDFAIDKETFFGSTTGANNILSFGYITLSTGNIFTSLDLRGSVFITDDPIVNTAQTRLLYSAGNIDTAPTVEVSIDNGSTWIASQSQEVSGLFVVDNFTFAPGLVSTGVKVRVTASMSSKLLGFGIDLVQDSTGAFAGDATFETRVITPTEASTGLISLSNIVFTPGAHQLHCEYSGHDFVAPEFIELGGGQVQFPAGFFTSGDTVYFYVTYGLVNLSNAPVTINNMLSSNSTMGDVTVPSGFTLDKPYMDIPAGATVHGAGDISTDGMISGDGVLATTGAVISRGISPTQPKFDSIEEASVGKGIDIKNPISGPLTVTGALTPSGGIVGKTDGVAVAAGYVGEIKEATVLRSASSGISSATATNVTSVELTTGKWLVGGQFAFQGGTATDVTKMKGFFNTTTAAFPGSDTYYSTTYAGSIGTQNLTVDDMGFSISPIFVNVTAASTVLYLVVGATYTGTLAAYGRITAIRIA